MKVYLVRHGEAVSSGIHPQRPLSEQGRADVQKVAAFIKPLGISVEHIRHSGKLRAAQTAEILTESVKVEKGCSEHEALGPNDDVTIINCNRKPSWASHVANAVYCRNRMEHYYSKY